MLTNRQRAANDAQKWLDQQPLFLDSETTDFDGVVLEIAVVDFDGVVLFDTLVDPETPISPHAATVHGITPEMLSGRPTFAQIWMRLSQLLSHRAIVCYNAGFDRGRLLTSASLSKLDYAAVAAALSSNLFLDLMELYADWYGEASTRAQPKGHRGGFKWQKLSEAVERHGLSPAGHRARADAEATRQLLFFYRSLGSARARIVTARHLTSQVTREWASMKHARK